MKSPTVAAIANFCIPGAGLWYLGRRKLASINFVLAAVAALVFAVAALELIGGRLHYLLLAIAAGSAGFAHAVAMRQARSQNVVD